MPDKKKVICYCPIPVPHAFMIHMVIRLLQNYYKILFCQHLRVIYRESQPLARMSKNKISSYFVGRIYYGIEEFMINIRRSKLMVAMITADNGFGQNGLLQCSAGAYVILWELHVNFWHHTFLES